MDLSGLDTVVKQLVEPDERFPFRLIEIDDVPASDWLVTLAHQSVLRLFESSGDFDLLPDAQEQWTRVFG